MSREPITVIRAAYVDLLLQELSARGKDRDALVRQFDLPERCRAGRLRGTSSGTRPDQMG